MTRNNHPEMDTVFCRKAVYSSLEEGNYREAIRTVFLIKEEDKARAIFLGEAYKKMNSCFEGKVKNPREALNLIAGVKEFIPEEWGDSLMDKFTYLTTTKMKIEN